MESKTMQYEEYLAVLDRIKWLKSQQKWHKSKYGNWHRNQRNFYKRQIRKAWNGFRFSDIVMFTVRNNTHKIAENVANYNALLYKLRQKNAVD